MQANKDYLTLSTLINVFLNLVYKCHKYHNCKVLFSVIINAHFVFPSLLPVFLPPSQLAGHSLLSSQGNTPQAVMVAPLLCPFDSTLMVVSSFS